MLFDGIPRQLKNRIAAELQIDLKVVKFRLFQKDQPDSRYSRAAIVTRHLIDAGLVGTLEAPKDYVAGELEMGWGIIGGPGRGTTGVAFFLAAREEPPHEVFFGGSPKHLQGFEGMPWDYPATLTPVLLQALREEAEHASQEVSDRHVEDQRYDWRFGITALRMEMAGGAFPIERFAFLARRVPHEEVLLGSPVWVERPLGSGRMSAPGAR